MTTTPAMPELPRETVIAIGKKHFPKTTLSNAWFGFAADIALATLQAQPAAVSDERLLEIGREWTKEVGWYEFEVNDFIGCARAILALRPQSESAAPTVEAAREMGAKGGPVVEAERLAFEAWMAGHCWAVSPTWNGETYDDSEEDKKRKLLDPLARTTRMLWAVWRDRAALSSLRPQAVPMTDEVLSVLQAIHRRPSDVGIWLDDLTRVIRATRGMPMSMPSKAAPKLIGWRTSDYLMETSDRAKADNWSVHHEMLPIFEGDPHTKLGSAGITAPAGGEG